MKPQDYQNKMMPPAPENKSTIQPSGYADIEKIVEQAEDDHPHVPITPDQLKRYPYFVDWCQELGRPLEDVQSISIVGETIELIPSPNPPFREFRQTDNYTAGMDFKDGSHVERAGKWSEGKMRYAPEEKEPK